jgi:hypothetical protein
VTQIQLTAGTLLVHVRRLDDNETYEIDTPNLAFSVLRPGIYRVSVNEAGDSTAIKVRSGQGEVTGGGVAYSINANQFDTFKEANLIRRGAYTVRMLVREHSCHPAPGELSRYWTYPALKLGANPNPPWKL